jgi:hypothetical protein
MFLFRTDRSVTLSNNYFEECGAMSSGGAIASYFSELTLKNNNEFVRCFSPCMSDSKPNWNWKPFDVTEDKLNENFKNVYSAGTCGRGLYLSDSLVLYDKCDPGEYVKDVPVLGDARGFYFKGCPSLCEPGYYKDNHLLQYECNSLCPKGHLCEKRGTGTPRPAKKGSYALDGLREFNCISGYYGDEIGLSTKECSGSCPVGHYCFSGSIKPLKCSIGTYQNKIAQSDCIPCPIGQYNSAEGQSKCKNCDPGKYSTTIGSPNCEGKNCGIFFNLLFNLFITLFLNFLIQIIFIKDCQPGKYANNNQRTTDCSKCNPGQFTINFGSTKCTSCLPGLSSSNHGSTGCVTCSPGTFSLTSIECENCPINYISTNLSAVKCIECPVGKHTNGYTGKSSCIPCDVGMFCPLLSNNNVRSNGCKQIKDSSCYKCNAGKYRTKEMKMTECLTCPPGVGTNNDGMSICLPCSKGTFYNNGQCTLCPIGYYTDREFSMKCVKCLVDVKKIEGSTSCIKTWKTADDCNDKYCLDDSYSNREEWECVACPVGGDCIGPIIRKNVVPLKGYWLVPWSKENYPSFAKCPYSNDCMGGRLALDNSSNVSSSSSLNQSIEVRINITNMTDDDINRNTCIGGTTGTCCAVCKENYVRTGIECEFCTTKMLFTRKKFFKGFTRLVIFLFLIHYYLFHTPVFILVFLIVLKRYFCCYSAGTIVNIIYFMVQEKIII